MSDSIGDFEFISLHGNVEPIKEQLLVIARPGVEGLAFWKQGRRGTPFVLRSCVDCQTRAKAEETFYDYAGLIGDDPAELVHADLVWTSYGVMVQVLDVRKVAVRNIVNDVGGKASFQGTGIAKALLEVDWTLVLVPVPQPSP